MFLSVRHDTKLDCIIHVPSGVANFVGCFLQVSIK